jgi:hypothetical protein
VTQLKQESRRGTGRCNRLPRGEKHELSHAAAVSIQEKAGRKYATLHLV